MDRHRLLIANRGEIAVRIIRTAQRLGLHTIAIYTPSDALSPHVSLATESVELPVSPGQSEAGPYLDVDGIVAVALAQRATLVHPGYGFLSENAAFARAVRDAGIGFLGPSTGVISAMGLKHEARDIAVKAGVPVIPGELAGNVEQAVTIAERLGYPVLIKASAGGGGMGMVVCNSQDELVASFDGTRARAKSLFSNDAVLLERYYPAAHHIEVQVFGNGRGTVIHMGERECSVQRRHQKVIEETPSPFLQDKLALRDEICAAAVRLCENMDYSSAGTVEFLVDDVSSSFFFLEMNTRIQVEHGITEVAQGSLDLVELMIKQGMEEARGSCLSEDILSQDLYADVPTVHAIEARIYAENPIENFRPSPGVLQLVDWSHGQRMPEWMRIDTWVSTGTTITPFFDPLLAKVIVTALSRAEALQRLIDSLRTIHVLGPTTNIPYLLSLLNTSKDVQEGRTTTQCLSTFSYTPRALTVLHPGLSSIVQDLPGRATLLHGIPPSGAMDPRAHSAANLLAGNPAETEALEVISVRGAAVRLKFWTRTLVGVAGGHSGMRIHLDGQPVSSMWSRVYVSAGSVLELVDEGRGDGGGFRAYIAVQGGFPDIPEYLGSKSTSMGFGGYQGRALASGDQIALAEPTHELPCPFALPPSLIPAYHKHWTIRVVCGPHDDTEFLTPEGINRFYSMAWTVSSSSNRMGIRLSPAAGQSDDGRAILWARENGGDGGSHPSNILDNAYARGSINVNGDTPVILGCEGPDMGGYVCLCAVIQADMHVFSWDLGQLHPGCTLTFERVSWEAAQSLKREIDLWVRAVSDSTRGLSSSFVEPIGSSISIPSKPASAPHDPRFHVIEEDQRRPKVVFRQAGDSAILVEYGSMELDLTLRARIHAFEVAVGKKSIDGIVGFGPCIRSTMCYYDPSIISQKDVLSALVEAEDTLPASTADMVFPGRRITLPIVLDDRWNREALEKYMQSTRDNAVYLPSNIQYLANNNGLQSEQEALAKLVQSDWLVFGVGFYLACPFLVPIDPRARLVGQKMNPSRTFTPRGAIGIAGVVAAIYPIESPGGYQLYGRTIPGWHTWGKGKNFTAERPWLLHPFDQVHFEVISEGEYEQLEKDFDAGRYEFKIEKCEFNIAEYLSFVESVQDEVHLFRERQAAAVAVEEARENDMLREWEDAQRAARDSSGNEEAATGTGDAQASVTAPISASVWRIKCSVGDVIKSANDVLVILEAMKTEISVTAGEEQVGKTVSGYGRGVREGAVVNSGDTLITLS
ncbi:urea carboxylase [Peniophora sp. CONT]|nr:urea carboxylase [Peniophora sp. CONT]